MRANLDRVGLFGVTLALHRSLKAEKGSPSGDGGGVLDIKNLGGLSSPFVFPGKRRVLTFCSYVSIVISHF